MPEYQILHWMHFIWLSGDQICEQAVHNVDVMTVVGQSHHGVRLRRPIHGLKDSKCGTR